MAIVATHVAAVQELYVAYFGRPADPAGLDYWTNVVEAQGGSTAAVSASFATQPEYIIQYFGKTNAQIVDAIYANMFGRAASTTDGRSYWVDLLNKGTVGISTIVAEVANGAQGADAEAVENKVVAATAFTAELDTPAEQAGYAGTSALTQAKAFITGVTTDATLTNAINPAALAATVAAVVKAGTPFSLDTGVAALRAANEALEDFLEENDLDASADPEGDLDGAVSDAADDIATEGGVTGFNTATSANVRAALLEEVQKENADTLAAEQKALATARAAASTSVRAVADDLAAATAANTEAEDAAKEAVLVQNAAEAAVEARAGGRAVTINLNADGEFVSATIAAGADATTAPAATLISVKSGSIVLDSATITEANFPGVTALRDAIRANEDAKLVADAAAEALGDANDGYAALSTANKALADKIAEETEDVAEARDAIDALAKLVAAYEDATDLVDEFDSLTGAVTAAVADFTAAGYLEPKAFNAATASATAGSDIFILGSSDEVTLSSFGRSGNDSIFLGSDFKLNAGDLEDGDNAVLEVFFVQNGSRAEIHVEKAVYGSESEDMAVITLIGVNADDLQFSNGVITLNTGA